MSEWELIGELSDLLKECHDTKTAGPVRKNSTVSPIPQKESSSDDKVFFYYNYYFFFFIIYF